MARVRTRLIGLAAGLMASAIAGTVGASAETLNALFMAQAAYSDSDVKAMTAYNLKVAAFNQQALTFNTCLKAYQNKAQHYIQEIQAAVQPASAESAH